MENYEIFLTIVIALAVLGVVYLIARKMYVKPSWKDKIDG